MLQQVLACCGSIEQVEKELRRSAEDGDSTVIISSRDLVRRSMAEEAKANRRPIEEVKGKIRNPVGEEAKGERSRRHVGEESKDRSHRQVPGFLQSSLVTM
jgi:hypothetical protein